MADDVKPNKLEPLKFDQVVERAQRMFDRLGEPPYSAEIDSKLTADEYAVLSEFVHYWRPYLVEKK